MGGTPPPFAENSAKIINLIFAPFPNVVASQAPELRPTAETTFMPRACIFTFRE